MTKPGNCLDHVTAVCQELKIRIVIARRRITEFFIVELRRASSGDFEVRFGEIHFHSGGATAVIGVPLLFGAGARLTNVLVLIASGSMGE
jgi:hypothetical protein